MTENWVDVEAVVEHEKNTRQQAGGDRDSDCASLTALTAASVAALTVYDMCKASSKGIVITNLEVQTSQIRQ